MKQYKMLLLLVTLAVYPRAQAQTATVTWTTIHQTMDGFGGQTWVFADNLTTTQAQMFFSPSAGIGLQYVRTANTFDGSIPDLMTLKSAAAQGALVELGLQSPPCTLKWSYNEKGEGCTDPGFGSGAFYDGTASSNGTCFTATQPLATSYSSWATYIVNYVNTLSSSVGAPISVVDVQNEPDLGKPSSLGACTLPASAFDSFVGTYLGPAFANASWNSTQKTSPQIMIASQAYNFPSHDVVSTCLNDSTCAQYVSIVSGHSDISIATSNFLGQSAIAAFQKAGGHLWLSEADISGTYFANPLDTSCTASGTGGLALAINIHNYLTQQSLSGYEFWELAYGWDENSGLTNENFIPTCRYYVQGNWSKFVRPGWVRIDATANPGNGVYVTAFKETTSGNFAIVAVNENSSPSNVEFSLTGFPSVTTVTPTLTSASSNLEDQTTANIVRDTFSYSLPETSVTTFHGTASSSNTLKTPASPTNLAASVK